MAERRWPASLYETFKQQPKFITAMHLFSNKEAFCL